MSGGGGGGGCDVVDGDADDDNDDEFFFFFLVVVSLFSFETSAGAVGLFFLIFLPFAGVYPRTPSSKRDWEDTRR